MIKDETAKLITFTLLFCQAEIFDSWENDLSESETTDAINCLQKLLCSSNINLVPQSEKIRVLSEEFGNLGNLPDFIKVSGSDENFTFPVRKNNGNLSLVRHSLLLERMIFRKIFFLERQPLCEQQHGFTEKLYLDSTLTYINDLFSTNDEKDSNCVVYLYFEMAFDFVMYRTFFEILIALTLGSIFLTFCRSFSH